MAELCGIGVPFLGNRPRLEGGGLLVEFRDAGLVHRADPDVSLLVGLEVERPDGEALLRFRDRIFRHLAGLRVHAAKEHLAEVDIPDHPFLVDDHVVRLGLGPRQVVLRNDDLRRFSGQARQGFQRILPRLLLTQIDRRQPLRDRLGVSAARWTHTPRSAHEPLRLRWRATGIVGAHPLEDLQELLGVVRRFDDALQRVTAVAIEQKFLVFVGARQAQQPFGIGELRGQIARLLELEVGFGHPTRRDVDRIGPVEIVPDGARLERVTTGLQSRRREAEVPLFVADRADRDRRIVLLGADDDPFHRSFLGRSDLAGETRGALRLRLDEIGSGRKHERRCDNGPEKQQISNPHFRPPLGEMVPCRLAPHLLNLRLSVEVYVNSARVGTRNRGDLGKRPASLILPNA